MPVYPRNISSLHFILTAILLTSVALAQSSVKPSPASGGNTRAAADRMAAKLKHIQQNGMKQNPDQTPTVLTEEEINSYFAEGLVKLPTGVKSTKFGLEPDIINGSAKVDFDELKAGRSSSNPLLSIFSGVHEVRVVAHASGSGGEGKVSVDSVALDDTQIPRMLLEIFVDKFLKPKYPNVGLDSTFKLTSKIDLAIVGQHKLTVTQK